MEVHRGVRIYHKESPLTYWENKFKLHLNFSTGDFMACLTVLDGNQKGQRLALENTVTRIGRRDGNDWVLDDASISGIHCEIEKSEIGFVIRDLGSTNGTMVNNESVKEIRLFRNDIIRIGDVPIEIEGDDVPQSGGSEAEAEMIPRTTIIVKPPKRTLDTPDAFGKKSNSTKVWVAVIATLVLVIAVLLVKMFLPTTQ